MPLLSSTEYPAIRGALDVDLTVNDLPDATLDLDIYTGKADRWVLSQVPDAESLTGDDLARMKSAATLYCASLLTFAVLRKTSLNIQARDMSFRRPSVDPDKLKKDLQTKAQDEIDYYLSPTDPAVSLPTFFTKVVGTRGG